MGIRATAVIAAVALAGAVAAVPARSTAADTQRVARANDPQPVPAGATALDAILVYDRAHAAVLARTLPPYIAYTQTVTFSHHGRVRKTERSRIVLRTADGRANIVPLAAADDGGPVGAATVADRPLIFPTTTFGFVRPPGETPSAYEPAAPPAPADGPAVIGHVTATNRAYDPTIAGRTSVDGRSVLLLRLIPRRDPEHNRIRAMAVDAASDEPLAITIEVDAHAGPVSSKPLAIARYEQVDGVWVIRRASIDFVARFGPFAYGGDGRLAIDDVSFPAAEPAWMFDAAALKAHAAKPGS